jgi:small-conductance mechanosensitive channel
MAINLAIAWTVVRFAYFYIKNTFWSRLVYIVILVFLALKVGGLWSRTVKLLDSMTIGLGKVSVSVWGLIEAAAIFILLWAASSAVNRFVAHRLAASDRLTTSDRILLQRVIRTTTMAVVILISLRASGLDLTTLAVTGGAIGFAIGIGLQKVGANLVGGIMLLLRKPVRVGDVIAFEESVLGASYGWITNLGILYVHVTTRDGTLLLIPNESFVTQKIENLSLNDNLVRLHIPFGISYASDLKKAVSLSISAAMNISRVLKNPGPKCLVREFGDSTVNLSLRVWINDPQNGIGSVKDAVLSDIWDRFHENGVEIAFPQRDLHIKDAVPLRIYREDVENRS